MARGKTRSPNALHLRRAGSRAAKPFVTPDPVPRINELIKGARTSWLGLLSYLAFIGVTLLGVTDADFFISERQTQLPLIGVTIPTARFFAVAPVLGVMLYTYLHLYLLKLWEELSVAPHTVNNDFIGDEIDPWLVADYALTFRSDSPFRNRPLRWLASKVSLVLIFVAVPLVLTGFWWRSMPKHDEMLTVIWCGFPLLISLYVAATSYRRLSELARHAHEGPIWRPVGWAIWSMVWFAVSLLGWLRTEGTLEDYSRRSGFYDAALGAALVDFEALTPSAFLKLTGNTKDEESIANAANAKISGRWWMQTDILTERQANALASIRRFFGLQPATSPINGRPVRHLLAQAQLSGEIFVQTPADWLVNDAAEQMFRKEWCRTEGLLPIVCGNGPFVAETPFAFLAFQRQKWCVEAYGESATVPTADCEAHFASRDEIYRAAWESARTSALNALPLRDLAGADLRGANLIGVRLERANLTEARLEGADLSDARLEGADFSDARLMGVSLAAAHLERAVLNRARLDGADLRRLVHLEGAFLRDANLRRALVIEARLDRADLSGAQLEGANFSYAHLQMAKLPQAQLQRAELREANLEGADLAEANLELSFLGGVKFSADTNFGDAIFTAASIRAANLTSTAISVSQVNSMFGDASVTLPTRMPAPAHWPTEDIDSVAFYGQWNSRQESKITTPPN